MGAGAGLFPMLAAAATAVTVRVEVPPAFHQPPSQVELVVAAVAGAGEFPPAVRHLLPGASAWQGTLRPGFTYRVEVSAPGWWAKPVMLRAGDTPPPVVVVPLWPNAELTLPWAAEAPPPASLEVGFTVTRGFGPGILATHRAACQTRGGVDLSRASVRAGRAHCLAGFGAAVPVRPDVAAAPGMAAAPRPAPSSRGFGEWLGGG